MSDQESSSRMSQDDKLAGMSNYVPWKSAIYNILLSKGLEEYVETTQTKPEEITKTEKDNEGKDVVTTTNISDIKAWTKNNAKAMVTIQQNCLSEPKALINKCKIASEMWSLFKNQYEGGGFNLIESFIEELNGIDYKKFSTIQ